MTLKAELIQKLSKEWEYSDSEAAELAERLLAMQKPVRDILEQWLKTGQVESSFAIEGYTLQQLMDEFGMNLPAALLTMDWLSQNPEEAIEALQAGFDRLEP